MVSEKMDRPDGGFRDAADQDQFWVTVDDDEAVSEVVVRTVTSVTGEDPMTIEPLGTVIDSDALNSLFARSGGDARFSFTFNGCHVTVHGGETVWVRPEDD